MGVTGSVAAVKWRELVLRLHAFADVKVVMTGSAQHFAGAVADDYSPAIAREFREAGMEALVPVLRDADEWSGYRLVHTDPVVHIELRKWADCLVVAPLSANTLAKIAAGMSDNLLTSIVRAWEFVPSSSPSCSSSSSSLSSSSSSSSVPRRFSPSKPLIVAPAMNTAMWAHPFTEEHIGKVERIGVQVVQPVEKRLACGDVGSGAMASVADIVAAVRAALANAGAGARDGAGAGEEAEGTGVMALGAGAGGQGEGVPARDGASGSA